MKANAMRNLLLLLCVAGLASCVSQKKFNELQEEKDALAESLASVEAKVDKLEEQNNELSTANQDLGQELNNVKGQLSETESRVAKVQSDFDASQNELDNMRKEVKAAFSHIEDAVADTDNRVTTIEDALYIDMTDTVTFRTASARVSASDKETIAKLAEMLNEHPNLHLVVEGNADKRSINNDSYKDNWELSAARSIAVVRELVKEGVDPTQLTAAGRAEFNPAVTEDPNSAETLAKNRRIELMVLPKIGTLYQMSK
jgi:chemotaxis protein MotB